MSAGAPPTPSHLLFVSYVREDFEEVRQLRDLLDHNSRVAGLGFERIVWVDTEDWLYGQKPFRVIEDAIRRSAFLMPWITKNYLKNRRGWVWMELALALQWEARLNRGLPGEVFLPFVLPAFRGVKSRSLDRTPLQPLWQQDLAFSQTPLSLADLSLRIISACTLHLSQRRQAHDEVARQGRPRSPGRQVLILPHEDQPDA